LRSSVLAWPDRAAVDAAVRGWAATQPALHPGLLRLGYFGSYARGDWGVGSDLDLVAVVADSAESFARRAAAWSTESLPVPAELLVYTRNEWDRLIAAGRRFSRMLGTETVWVYPPA
jgi:hypothetical protein